MPPPCPVTVKRNEDPTAKRICIPFAAQGLFCPHSKCKNLHLTDVSKIPLNKRNEFVQYVVATNNLKFAAGREPPSE
jgi:hypothetical protein